MKRVITLLSAVVMMASILLPSISISADSNTKDEYASLIGVKQVADNNMEVVYTGKHFIDDEGDTNYEMVATVYQAPIYNDDGSPVDCSWYYTAPAPLYADTISLKEFELPKITGYTEGYYEIRNNIYYAKITGSEVSTTYQGETLMWNPIVIVGKEEYIAKDAPILLAVDPINENYRNNTLQWDYGVCLRRVRIIEGLLQETWVFEKNPLGTVWIKDNAVKTYGYVWDIQPYAVDSAGNHLEINEFKQISSSEFDRIEKEGQYPVIIDPTASYYTTASDGYNTNVGGAYNTIWTAASSSSTDSGSNYLYISNDFNAGASFYDISRAYVFFDTTGLPDSAVPSSATMNLTKYSQTIDSGSFSVNITAGMPTYPHDPVVAGDYDKSYYSGDYGNLSSTVWSGLGYLNISLTSSGVALIDPIGITKLCLRHSKDIAGTSPSNYQMVILYSYEKGVGYRPCLVVTYWSSGSPTVSTQEATYTTASTARLNGYLDDDGGEPSDAHFNYQRWYGSGWKDCIELTINASYVESDLTNFPVLITGAYLNTTDPDFWASCRSNGSDIIFTSSDGVTKLDRELVSFCASTYSMECYVKVPSIDDTNDTKIYMYYNNSAGVEANSTGTWDSNYTAVFHMNDLNTSAIDDSTINDLKGYKLGANAPIQSNGIFNGDKAQEYDGGDDYIYCSSNATVELQTINSSQTIEVINRIREYNASIHSGLIGQQYRNALEWMSTSYYYGIRGGATIDQIAKNYGTLNVSQYVAGTYNGTTKIMRLSINLSMSTISTTSTDLRATSTFQLGRLQAIISGTSILPNCSLTEIRLSNISRSSAWVNATYSSMMLPNSFCNITDIFTSTADQEKETGESLHQDISSLLTNNLYGFKAEATNSYGTTWGHWMFINTSVTLLPPSLLSCSASSNTINLSWVKGGNSSQTYIRWETGSFPSSSSDGNAIANQSDVDYSHSGLSAGVSYYYRMWGLDGGILSANSSTLMCTTLAGYPEGSTAPLPTWNTSGNQDNPNGSVLENNPLYALGNLEADAIAVPHSTWWMLLGLGGLVATGLFIYTRSRNLLAAVGAMIIFGVLLAQMGIFPMWIMYIFGFAGIGLGWKELR